MFRHILFPVDPRETDFARPALAHALDLARRYGARLTLMAVAPVLGRGSETAEDRAMQAEREAEIAARLRGLIEGEARVDAAVQVVHGRHAADEIITAVRRLDADMVVMRSHDRGRLEGMLLGSVAEKVMRHAHCSVTVIRQR